MKTNCIIFSDCFTYSGSENVVENLLLSNEIKDNFNVRFLYGANRIYESRFLERARLLGIDTTLAESVYLLSPERFIYQYKLNRQEKKSVSLLLKAVLLKVSRLLFISYVYNLLVLVNSFRKIQPKFIYINNGGYPGSLQCCLAVFAAKICNIDKIYFNINNTALAKTRFYDAWFDSLINRCVTKFITASYAAQNSAIEERSFDRDKFIRIPNTIFNDEVLAGLQRPKKTGDVIYFGSVGLLTERKGYHVLLEAITVLVKDYKVQNFKVVLVGDGEERENLLIQTKNLQIEAYVDFLGFISEPTTIVKNFDVFILPSTRNEDFPYVILEAMILAKPIIGSKVAGIPEQIEHYRSGVLTEPANALDLAQAMNFFISEVDKVNTFGNKSKAIYFEKFAYKHILSKYTQLFSS